MYENWKQIPSSVRLKYPGYTLLPSNVKKLLFLKYNLRSLEYRTQIPSPPEDFQLHNRKSYEMTIDNNRSVNSDDDNLYDTVDTR